MKILSIVILLTIIGCADSSKENSDSDKGNNNIKPPTTENQMLAIPDNRDVDHYKILFIGNSHVAGNNLANIVKKLFEHNLTTKLVTSQLAPGSAFLDERVDDGITYEKIKSDQWTHIILQAQKVSSSQSRLYPTEAAETWVELVKAELSATPILFPEHPQKGNTVEARYIHNIHVGIAQKSPACIAPIGLAWDLALRIYPDLQLHRGDGNHANIKGAFLSAMVLYQTISGESTENLAYIASIDVDRVTQRQLAQVASQAIANNDPCQF